MMASSCSRCGAGRRGTAGGDSVCRICAVATLHVKSRLTPSAAASTQPQGPWDDTVAGVTDDNKIQVCNSWVYIVDEVLKPAYDLE